MKLGFALENRNAIITGASQGLGLAIAKAFVESGASGVMCARGEEELRQAGEQVTSCAQNETDVVTLAADISKQSDAERVAQTALASFTQVHILVNNAGIYGPKG